METKVLRLEGSPGKVENHYSLTLEVPSKLDLLSLVERPPFHILSKNDTTFSTGVLAHVPHSLKIRIARDYQEPFIGIFLKLSPKSEDLVEVLDIKGVFALPNTAVSRSPSGSSSTSSNSNSNHPSPSSSVTNATGINLYSNGNLFNQNGFASGSPSNHNLNLNNYRDPHYENLYPNYLNNNAVNIINNNVAGGREGNNLNEEGQHETQTIAQQKRALFNFFKSTVTKYPDFASEHYDYYESRSHWPDVASKLCIFIRITKINYSVIVNDECNQLKPMLMPNNMFNSEPFFMSKSCSDVVIKVGPTKFPAHKIILTARSKYFARMFSSDMREAVEGVVKIDDVEESLMKQMLSFIYLGKVEDMETYASDLLLLSDKYDIEDLSIYCEKYLLDNLCVENAIEMYDLSHTVGRKGLLAKKAKEIIMWNKDKFEDDVVKELFVKYPDFILELLKM